MCYPVKCAECAKTTWAGDGQHIEMVRSNVEAGQWCPGHAKTEKPQTRLFARFFSSSKQAEARAGERVA
ncbi:hypothetical protein GCM10022286_12780 [Gryllotalpicola daejeonensis]|uniref:Ferredoxin n=1 Tax=Gryllotalpicola daejeonensis TaxID=993087 RepID=A0ABP7ZIH5_9MICO